MCFAASAVVSSSALRISCARHREASVSFGVVDSALGFCFWQLVILVSLYVEASVGFLMSFG